MERSTPIEGTTRHMPHAVREPDGRFYNRTAFSEEAKPFRAAAPY